MPEVSVEIAKNLVKTGVKSTYGDPIQLDDATVIPVASHGFVFGSSEGKLSDAAGDDGAGKNAGGGGVSIPLGAYVKRGHDLRFEPNLTVLLLVGVPFICVAGKALARIIRALKR